MCPSNTAYPEHSRPAGLSSREGTQLKAWRYGLNGISQILVGIDTAFNGIPETYVGVEVCLLEEPKGAQTSTADYSEISELFYSPDRRVVTTLLV